MSTDREQVLTRAFVSIANSMADGVDVVELLSGLARDCAQLLDIASAGLLLADPHGGLHVLAASSEPTRELEIFQVQREQGPCVECYRTGQPVNVDDLTREASRWPDFVAAALAAGFASVHTVPMRLRDTVLGALGLFGTSTGLLGADDLALAQALAHVASIAIVVDKAASDQVTINHQLQTALDSRVIIEQAKGILAQFGGLDMEQSFNVLRRYARDHNQRLSSLARHLVARDMLAEQVMAHAQAKARVREALR
jgi:transcriptional regulator with GAF, ATPase, and Fis domain